MSEIQELEYFLLNKLSAEDRLVMDAKFLVNQELSEKAYWQRKTYSLIQQYSRKKLKLEIEAVHKKIFAEKRFETFRQKILLIFKK